jgi:hypothetical protein
VTDIFKTSRETIPILEDDDPRAIVTRLGITAGMSAILIEIAFSALENHPWETPVPASISACQA